MISRTLLAWMRIRVLEDICCPRCGGELDGEFDRIVDEFVISGELRCARCGEAYPIIRGIPRMSFKVRMNVSERLWRILYNIYAPFYDRVEAWAAERLGFREEELRENVVKRLRLRGGEKILEICIGTGGNLPYLSRYNPSAIYGIDFSEKMLEVCLKRLRKLTLRNVELFIGLAEYLPFKAGLFDAILNLGGITYFTEKKRAIEEMFRVARRGARIVICEQITLLEKLLGKAEPPISLIPEKSSPSLEYIYGGRFYVIEATKT